MRRARHQSLWLKVKLFSRGPPKHLWVGMRGGILQPRCSDTFPPMPRLRSQLCIKLVRLPYATPCESDPPATSLMRRRRCRESGQRCSKSVMQRCFARRQVSRRPHRLVLTPVTPSARRTRRSDMAIQRSTMKCYECTIPRNACDRSNKMPAASSPLRELVPHQSPTQS